MKKILILTSDSGKTASWKEREVYVSQFAKKVELSLKDYKVLYTTYSDLVISVIGNQTVVFDERNCLDLKAYSLVHFKNWQYEAELASVIANYLETNAVPFVNTEVNNKLHSNKLSQMVALAYEQVPVPDTVYIPIKLYDRADDILSKLDFVFPLIVKADDGSRGDDNYLVRTKKALQDILLNKIDTQFIFQSFIPNDGDYRILYIGLGQQSFVFLRKGDDSTHLNNTSKGGSGQKINYDKLSYEVRQSALRAAKVLKREIGGVDVIIDKKTGKFYVLEVNSTPAIATGFALEDKLQAFSAFIKENIEEKEEE